FCFVSSGALTYEIHTLSLHDALPILAAGNVKDGIIKTLSDMDVPFVLSGSIRDDGPLPEVIGDTDKALTETKKELDKATLVICIDRKSTRLNSSHVSISYAVFCLKKK